MVEEQRILIVDDEQGMRDSLTFMLESEGFINVQTSPNGEAALEKLDGQPYAVIVTDLEMPRMNGYALMQEIQRRWPDTIVIAITGYGSTESATECLRRGAFDYITKPFNVDVILAVIRRAVDRFRLEMEARVRTEQLAVMAETTRIINSSLNIQDVYGRFAAEVKRLLEFDIISIALFDEARKHLRIVAATVPESSLWQVGDTVPIENTCLGIVATHGGEYQQSDLGLAERLVDEDMLYRSGIHSIIVLPLVVESRVIGAFMIGSNSPAVYDEAQMAIAKQVSGLVATAANNMLLYEQLQSQLGRLRRTQSQLVRSARLAAVGELADGVAHEINNPLSVVLGVVQLLLRQPDLPGGVLEDLEKISVSANRIASITRTFIEFAKPATAGKLFPLQITDVFESALLLVQSQFSDMTDSIQMKRVLEPDLPLVMGNEGQLRRAFVAIIRNSFEAMAKAQSHQPDRTHELTLIVRSYAEDELRFLDVTIQDTGIGIAENHLNRIFEPGFTTKIEKGTVRGLGMGLFSAYGIIDTHGGSINVESEVGRGTKVTVTLSTL